MEPNIRSPSYYRRTKIVNGIFKKAILVSRRKKNTNSKVVKYEVLVDFRRACAPVRCAHPSFPAHCHAKRGAARPPAHRSFAASHSTSKNKQNLSNLGRPHQGLFSFHWTTEAMKYEVRAPAPPIVA
jgi:hypothetical protein